MITKQTRGSAGMARSAMGLSLAMIFSQLVGLLSKSLMGSIFGASASVDAFLAANRLTETIFNLMAGGALASAFIPAFSAALDQDDQSEAWKLASRMANLLFCSMLIITVAGFIFAPQITRYLLAPGFSLTDPAMQTLTVRLLRIQLPSALIFGLSGLMMGVLNANGHFLLPGLAPAMYQIGMIIGVVFLSRPFGVEGLAMGAVLGSALHFMVQLPQLIRLPNRQYHFSLGLKNATVRETVKLMIPRQIGASAVQLNFLVNNYLASFLAFGSISALSWGLAIMLMPQAAIAQSAATVSLPLFSVQAARGRLDEMRSALAETLRLVLMLAIPSAIGLMLLSQPLTALIFQRRAFTPEMTLMVRWALIWYSAGLAGHCVVEVVSRAFYAMHDTRTPVLILFIAMSLNMLMSLGFSKLFSAIGWMPHGGLALANSLATFLEMWALLFFMRRRLDGLEGRRVWRGILNFAIAACVMAGGLIVWLKAMAGQGDFLLALGGAIVGAAIYLVMCALLRVDEMKLIKRLLSR